MPSTYTLDEAEQKIQKLSSIKRFIFGCTLFNLCIIGTLIFLHYDNKRMERELQQSDYASLCGVAGEWAHEATFIRDGVCRIKPYTNLGDIRMTDWHNGR